MKDVSELYLKVVDYMQLVVENNNDREIINQSFSIHKLLLLDCSDKKISNNLYIELINFMKAVMKNSNNKIVINKTFEVHKMLIINAENNMIKINDIEMFKSDALECLKLIEAGYKIKAIKNIREKYELGLKEAKELSEKIADTKSLFLC